MTDKKLVEIALETKEKAYNPYSNFSVGAALLCQNGKVYLGCNIENAAYGETVCAERVAFFEAVKNGERDFSKIAIVGDSVPCFPCGSCRQVMAEFCNEDFEIILSENEKYTLKELLPHSFLKDNLKG